MTVLKKEGTEEIVMRELTINEHQNVNGGGCTCKHDPSCDGPTHGPIIDESLQMT